jgi:squalene-hopene/tetraprenyl-beta-curcumene cyclase
MINLLNPKSEKALMERAKPFLLRLREDGVWHGELSSSALSTATALLALHLLDQENSANLVDKGLAWLAEKQWASGGWGDTDRSLPNISTTLLCWAALGVVGDKSAPYTKIVQRAEQWIVAETGTLDPEGLARAILTRYGKDQTFSVPILMACALGGRLGASPGCWKLVPQLPCELAAFPRKWFSALSLRVVSYALPALIAIGQVRHFHAPKRGPGGWLRNMTRRRVLRLLREIQPESGGYLEAIPLTSFVGMALAGMGLARHPVGQAGLDFLHASVRPDGSWPIDTNLATWVTTLAVKSTAEELKHRGEVDPVLGWLLGQQTRSTHPFTLSAPGAWAWTDLSGGVPDADDTSGTLLALHALGQELPAVQAAAAKGVRWLLDLQNRDGGMPTFCRGWGALPFDRSCAEITAHALAAWETWGGADNRLSAAKNRALRFLEKSQAKNGSWTPLWFGNQHTPDESNPVYGTAVVVGHLCDLPPQEIMTSVMQRAVDYLLASQLPCGGWGGAAAVPNMPASIEETAVAVLALSKFILHTAAMRELCLAAVERGVKRLTELTDGGRHFPASPIGLYFARLWYYEQLYPVVWTIQALTAAERVRVKITPPDHAG